MEKFTTEYIEQYLEGKLNDADRRKIEAAMAIHPELREEIALQKALVQKMNRRMLSGMIKDAHLRHAGKNSFDIRNMFGKWILGSLLLAGIVAGTWMYLSNQKENVSDVSSNYPKVNVIAAPIILTDQTETTERPQVVFTNYTFIAEKGAKIIDGRSGTVISIPANALKIKQSGQLAKGEVTLKYREFRTQADIALSNIPMTYKDKNFNSAGMFEILAVQNTDTLEIVNGRKVDIDFVMTKNEPGIGFYFLNPENNQWELLKSLDKKEDSVISRIVTMPSWGPDNEATPDTSVDLKDPFTRAMQFQQAHIENRTFIPKVSGKDTMTFNTYFIDNSLKTPVGAESKSDNKIIVQRITKKTKKKGKFGGSFIRIPFLKRRMAVVETNTPPSWSTTFFITQGKNRFEIFETGNKSTLVELGALKNVEFFYNGTADLDYLTGQTIIDLRLTRDTTVYNRFVLELKIENRGILKYQISLTPNGEITDFSVYDNYINQRRIRMMSFDEKVKAMKDLLAFANARRDSLNDLKKYGEDNVYQMARLIMTEDELKMSPEEWYASLKDNKAVAKRIQSHLDSLVAYSESNDYMRKLMKNNNESLAIIRDIQYKNQIINMRKASNNYNNLVANLSIRGFGIYNCDQVYRIASPIQVQGRFFDENNKELTNSSYLSLIDARVNAAFSFSPGYFTCSSVSKTSLVLFAGTKIYYLSADEWKAKQIKQSGVYSFKMKDITEKVKNPRDLQNILEQNSL
ncbi:MAG: hypothetical protein K2X86_06405 [Cytophagaceae bacterium]|nr:hypothetical protein [Cytophagaceae bacterium]